MMKSFTIIWDRLRQGSFPIEDLKSIKGIDIVVTKAGIFSEGITFTSNTDEEFDLSLAFHIGQLVSSYTYSHV